jgi:hypothetical protein
MIGSADTFSELNSVTNEHLSLRRWAETAENARRTKNQSREDQMAITRDLLDITRIRRTMRAFPYEEAKAASKRFLEESMSETDVLTDWDSSFAQYIEERKNSKLLFCWYAQGVAIVFSPADHHGVWALQREGIAGKGVLPEYALEIVERIAKEKALA